MTTHYRTLGFVLKKTDRGESDQSFSVFTSDFGKLEITAKAIRKINSKLRSGIDIFYLSEIEFIQGKNQKTLTDAIAIEKFEGIKKDFGKIKTAYRIAEALDGLIRGQEKDQKIYDLLEEVFYKLDDCAAASDARIFSEPLSAPIKLEIIFYYFIWNLFSVLGYQVNLYNCALCQKKLSPQYLFFNSEEGGIICDACFLRTGKGERICPDVVKIVRLLAEKNWKIAQRLKIEESHRELLEKISENYLCRYVNR